MINHAYTDLTIEANAHPLDITSLIRRAGIPYPARISLRLAERYGLTPEAVLDDHLELYDLAWATALVLNRLLPCHHCRIGGDEFYELEFWSLLPGSAEPAAMAVTVILEDAGTPRAALHFTLPGELPARTRRHVLVVDDDLLVRDCLQRLLERNGFRVSAASNLAGARGFIEHELPDLILMEAHLTDGSGIRFCQQLKLIPRTAGVPVVFCTGDYNAQSHARSAGAADFLEKPVGLIDLGRRLHAVLAPMPAAKNASHQNS